MCVKSRSKSKSKAKAKEACTVCMMRASEAEVVADIAMRQPRASECAGECQSERALRRVG